MYIYRRGKNAKRRVFHLEEFDRLGRPLMRSLCGRTDLNTTINLPLGRKVCQKCRKIAAT